MLSIKKTIRSFGYALSGFRFVWREDNFKIHVLISFLVIFLAYYFGVNRLEKVALVLVIATILILESLNTIFEHLSDILKPRLHDYIKIIKDIMASIVLMASIASIIVGFLIFWPYFVDRF